MSEANDRDSCSEIEARLERVREACQESDRTLHRILVRRRLVRHIAQWTIRHSLTADEVTRLRSVFTLYDAPDDWTAEINYELKCVLAARKLATRPPLTNEQIDRARAAFEAGFGGAQPQEVD